MSKTEINNYFIHLNTKEGLIAASNDGTILDINTAAKKLLGIPDVDIIDSFNFLDSFEFYDLNTFDLLSAQQHPFSIFLKNKSDQEYIVGVKDASGLFIWINCSFTTILDKEQDCTLISLLNYTKIVNQNIQLKKQEHHQNLLVAALNDIVFEISSTGVYINYWTNNPELLFYQPEDFLGKSVYELFPEDMSSKAMYYIHKTLQTRKEQIIPFPSPKDITPKTFFQMRLIPIPQFDDRIILVISDITKETGHINQLKFQEHKFQQAFNYSGIGTALTALDGKLIDGNKLLFDLLGYSKEELQNIYSNDLTHPDDREKDLEYRQNLLHGEQEYYTFEKSYLNKKGYYVVCSVTISLVHDENDVPLFFIVQIQDITDYKRKTLNLQQKQTSLEKMTLDLESKIIQLEESNYILAHNIKSPTSNIAMLINSINEKKTIHTDDELWKLLEESSNELSETLKELNQILSIKQNINVSVEKCYFQDITKKIIDFNQQYILEKNIEIRLDFQVPYIYYPKSHLENIIENLFLNAITFIDDNRTPFVEIKTYMDEKNLVLEIKDNGLGIDLDKFKSQLFMFKKIFHRGFENKGIGLFMVKYLVESFDGKIDVKSNVGEGSSFYVKFSETNYYES